MYLKHLDLRDYIYIDGETDGLNPSRFWCLVAQNIGTGELFELVGHEAIRSFFSRCPKDTIFVGHNAISFDVPHLNRLGLANIDLCRVVDTLVLSYLYGTQGGHSLEAWGERLKFPKGEWNDWSAYSELMLAYCIRDVELGVRVFNALTGRMAKRGYSESSCALEHNVRVIIDEQQRNGWYFDVPSAEKLLSSLRGEERDLGGQVHELFPPVLKSGGIYRYRTTKGGEPYASYLRHLEQYPKLTFNAQET
jgi:hypothetical protein